ncbi:L,D-transpeptidase family protein [Flavobacterium salilacus subsp. salilacus]|uniref:L,D-transpeptidase family protein n=1 Tax=Flavobacterium TaxID=237 RepID=UPI0010751D00|nr:MULTISPECIES: L,D-transpeptidase family protein [Flavobacterium]KAF2516266.1 L,D-transpeptidase family protein [Flavobacterium salilacus subsp. salilacus]MBE1613794.1 L,D-transpeptidase family protein [Flavobacterium sp. SaA2.13]
MKKLKLSVLLLSVFLAVTTLSCKKDKNDVGLLSAEDVHNHDDEVIPLDSTAIDPFFDKYPDFKEFNPQVKELYKKHNYHYIWQDKKGIIEFANVLYNRVNQLDEEGLTIKIPYQAELNNLFYGNVNKGPDFTTEMLISSMYFYYTKKVYAGLNEDASKETGWYLPRERTSYVAYLDTLMSDPLLITENTTEFFKQYYNLKKGLKKYRDIEQNGGWGTINLEKGIKSIKPGDSATAVLQVRERLFKEGYLTNNNNKNIYDSELFTAVSNYNAKHNRESENFITPSLVKELNIPVEERIKTISVNMERCRWITPKINTAKEYIAVNIPSYRLHYFINGKPELISRVVVGKELNKTVVFSGEMSYIAFSPYWNIPESILEKEIKPGIAKNHNYLAEHNMEWVGNRVRQKPGGKNSLGLVKFMFPNSNNIYLHDTPAKSLFNKEERAFSHGCVRVEKAKELALAITQKHGGWDEKKVDKAMHMGRENIFKIENKIPVYIAYFTAWADEEGNVAFFDDVYKRDDRLAHLLYKS